MVSCINIDAIAMINGALACIINIMMSWKTHHRTKTIGIINLSIINVPVFESLFL